MRCGLWLAAVCLISTVVHGAPADPALVYYASFDADSGSVVKDHSLYANRASLEAGAALLPGGKYGRGAAFWASGALLVVPTSNVLGLRETATLEAWVNPGEGSLGGSAGFIMQKAGNYNLWFMENGQVRVADTHGEKLDTENFRFRPGRWYHIAGILDSRTPRRQIYVNGELVAQDSAAFDLETSTEPLLIGEGLQGVLDEVRVWNMVRAAEQVRRDMLGPGEDQPRSAAAQAILTRMQSLQKEKSDLQESCRRKAAEIDVRLDSLRAVLAKLPQ